MSYRDVILSDSPVGYWQMADTTGPLVAEVGNNIALGASTAAPSLNNQPGPLLGNAGGYVGFDGSNDYASVALDLSTYNKITIEFWLWWNTNANDDDLVMEFTASTLNAGSFHIDLNESSTGTCVITVGNNAPAYNQAKFTRPTAAAWHHWAVLLDRSAASQEVAAVYIDGVAQTLSQVGLGTGNHTDNFANSTLFLMCRNGAALFGAGRMVQLAIYGSNLSADRVLAHYRTATTSRRRRLFAGSY